MVNGMQIVPPGHAHVITEPEESNFDYTVVSYEARETMWWGILHTRSNKRLNYFEIKLFLLT